LLSHADRTPRSRRRACWFKVNEYGITDVLNPGKFERLPEVLADDFVDHEALRGIPPTRDGIAQKYTMLRSGFSDFRFEVDDLLEEADRVECRVTVRGTHDGDFMGRPPTGRTFVVSSLGIFRVKGSHIVEHWGVFDQMAMLGQLGAFGNGQT
jgi:predicted ester cyclase